MYIQNNLFMKSLSDNLVIFLTEKEIFKLANIKHTVTLLSVIRLAISYFKLTLKKYL